MHPMGLDPTTSSSTVLLQGKKVPLELELVGIHINQLTRWHTYRNKQIRKILYNNSNNNSDE